MKNKEKTGMNRKRGVWLLVSLLLCLCLLVGCGRSIFDGSRMTSDDCFFLAYTMLNGQETSSLSLRAGDVLRVVMSHDRGTVAVTIGLPDEEPIYEGNGLSETSFTLQIHEDGTYRLAVTGTDACGQVSFTRLQAEDTDE